MREGISEKSAGENRVRGMRRGGAGMRRAVERTERRERDESERRVARWRGKSGEKFAFTMASRWLALMSALSSETLARALIE